MSLPRPLRKLWNEMQESRAELLHEVEGMGQPQADWRPAAGEWSIGEVLDHLIIAENATGRLTTKLTREAEATGALAPYPGDSVEVAPLPPWPPGPAEAPEAVRPAHGKPIGELVEAMRATRERSRQSLERLATLDVRPLRFPHARLGELDLGQWWRLQAEHDRIHLDQVRAIRRAPEFPA